MKKTILILLAIVIIIGCSSPDKKKHIIEESIKTEIMKGVFVYEANRNIDSVVYYVGDKRIMQLDKNDFLFDDVVVFKKLKLKIPKGWLFNSDFSSTDLSVFIKENNNNKKFTPSISIQQFSKNNIDIDNFYKLYFNQINGQYDKLSIYNVFENSINDIENSRQINYSFEVDGKKMVGLSVFYEIGEFYYLFEGLSSAESKYEKMNYIPVYQISFESAKKQTNSIVGEAYE